MKKTQVANPFWGAGEKKDFGKVAIEYAAGKDVVLDQAFVQDECLLNEAHQLMLAKLGILPKNQVKKILRVLEEIKELDKKGKFKLKKELEDVHSNVEKYVLDKLGIEIGGNLRLGIARNDQTYTATRMLLRGKILVFCLFLGDLVNNLSKIAAKNTRTVMPGYTHLRISQPITYAHWLLAKCYHFLDDFDNLLYDFGQVNLCPLGIFEMAGTHLPIDRGMTAKLLGFNGILINSLYASNTRGEIEAKVLADFSILAMHIKRTMQEVILWSTHEFGFLQIDDLYTTGGTAQPNLKNPDTLEVIRANCAKVYARFWETLIIMDSLPSGYNRDTQQTKQALFEAIEIIEATLPVFTGIMISLKLNKEKMAETAEVNFAIAPDVSIQIAIKGGISFREAYKVVKTLIKKGYLKKNFSQLTPELLNKVAKNALGKSINLTPKEIKEVSTARACVLARISEGGPAPLEVKKMIKDVNKKVKSLKGQVFENQTKIKKAYRILEYKVINFCQEN